MRLEIVRFNKKIAESYLRLNRNNRPLSKPWVDELAGRMTRGEWKLNGEAIKLSDSDMLLDGQHRLAAIAKANISLECLVIRGVDQRAFDTMDQGKVRGAADILAINGEKYASLIAAAAKILFILQASPQNPVFSRVTPIQIENVLHKHPELRESAKVAEKVKHILAGSIAAALWVLFRNKDPELADEFFSRLHDGAGLAKHHPVKTLRDRLIVNSASTAKLRQKPLCALVIKSWNACRLGREMKMTRWKDDESFPEII